MTKEVSFWDEVTDQLKQDLIDVRAEVREQFKGMPVYRQKQVPERDLLFNYMHLTQYQKDFYQQKFGVVWGKYIDRIEKIRGKLNA